MTEIEHKSDNKLTKDTPYLTLIGEPWRVYYRCFKTKCLLWCDSKIFDDETFIQRFR